MKDDTNKTALYFEKYKEGWKLKDIASHFDRSTNTIRTYLKKHPNYKPRGKGNKISKANGRVLPKSTGTSINRDSIQVVFNFPQELIDRLDDIRGSRKDKFIAAIENYLSLKVKDRPIANLRARESDRTINFACPNELANKLDKQYKNSPEITRTDKIIAAVELYLIEKTYSL